DRLAGKENQQWPGHRPKNARHLDAHRRRAALRDLPDRGAAATAPTDGENQPSGRIGPVAFTRRQEASAAAPRKPFPPDSRTFRPDPRVVKHVLRLPHLCASAANIASTTRLEPF